MTSLDDETHRRKWLCIFFILNTFACKHTHKRARTHTHTHAGTINDGNSIQVAVFYLPVAEDRILRSKLWHFFHSGCHWSQQVVCFSFSPSDWMIEVSIISLLKGWWTHAGSVTALFLHSSTHINQKMLQMRGRVSVLKMAKRPRRNNISASRFNSANRTDRDHVKKK